MADRYVVPAGGNWNSTATWSATNGGAGGASIPTASDDVYLTSLSGNLAHNATATINSFDCSGFTGAVTGASAMTVSGPLFRLSSGMTYSRTGALTLNSTGAVDIDSAGQTMGHAVTFNGAGGAFTLQNILSITGVLTLTAGALVANGYGLASGSLASTGSVARSLDISDVTFAIACINTTPFNVGTTANNLTVNASGSTIEFAAVLAKNTLTFGNHTWGAISFPDPQVSPSVAVTYSAGCSFEALNIVPPMFMEFTAASVTLSITTPMSLQGSNIAPICLFSTAGSILSVASGTVTFDWCALGGMSFTGGAVFNATNALNFGNNTGLTSISLIDPSPVVTPQTVAEAVWDMDLSARTNNIAKTGAAIGRGAVSSGASATSIPTSAFSIAGADADQFKGRVVLFDADTVTAGLRGQATAITASSVAATPTFTVSPALTHTPTAGDAFSVI